MLESKQRKRHEIVCVVTVRKDYGVTFNQPIEYTATVTSPSGNQHTAHARDWAAAAREAIALAGRGDTMED